MTHLVSDFDLQDAYRKMANVISKYGERYLPIFERLENELNERRAKSEVMQRAIQIADSNSLSPIK